VVSPNYIISVIKPFAERELQRAWHRVHQQRYRKTKTPKIWITLSAFSFFFLSPTTQLHPHPLTRARSQLPNILEPFQIEHHLPSSIFILFCCSSGDWFERSAESDGGWESWEERKWCGEGEYREQWREDEGREEEEEGVYFENLARDVQVQQRRFREEASVYHQRRKRCRCENEQQISLLEANLSPAYFIFNSVWGNSSFCSELAWLLWGE